MRRALHLLPVLAVAAFGLPGCYNSNGGGSNPATIAISPSSANVPVGLTAQFTGTVSGSNSTSVTYQVNGVNGGDAVHGMISASGLYTAPNAIPNQPTVTVTAVAQVNSSLTASATVTIVAATVVTVSPAAISVRASAQQTFIAMVNGMPSTNVSWQVNGVNGGDSIHGTITSAGVYTAPASPPPGGTVMVTAVSKGPAVGSGSATVTILFSNASLKGQYAFTFTGTTAIGILTAAGSVSADGNGNIATGIEDINSSGSVASNVSISGGYSITPDGRGSMTLNLPAPLNSQTIRFVLLNNRHGLLIRFDAFATATGSIDLQDSSAFSNAALAAKFVFNFSGVDSGNFPLAFAGAFTPSGAGINGVADINDAGTVHPNLGIGFSLNVGSTGRGVATVTVLTSSLLFSFYVVDTNTLDFVELDPGAAPVLSGQALAQASGPISPALLNGNFAFTAAGAVSTGPFASGGIFTANGTSSITSGVMDMNSNGNTATNVSLLATSAYTLASNGRGTLTLNINPRTFNFAIYPAANGTVQMLETDTNIVASGAALSQTTGLLVGSFGFNLDGDTTGGNGSEFDASGQTNMDSSGNLSGGLLDFNNTGILSTGVPWTLSNLVGTNGRGTGTVNTNVSGVGTLNVAVYAVNSSTVLMLGLDSGDVSVGILSRQF